MPDPQGVEPARPDWGMEQQQQPTRDRRRRLITFEGQRLTLLGWAEARDIAPRILSERLSRGWPIERALGTPSPKGFQEGHAEQLAKGKAWWAAHGRAWRERRVAAAAADGWDVGDGW